MAKLLIKYVKSTIACPQDQKDTIKSLGLRKLNSIVLRDDSATLRGMIFKVQHLVSVEELADNAVLPAKPVTVRPRIIKANATPSAVEAPVAPKPIAATTQTLAPTLAAPVAPAPVAVTAQTLAPTPVAVETTAASDDLEIIEGIGPRIAGVLRNEGVTTFAQLAQTDTATLSTILQGANLSALANPESWPEQAQLAADGKHEELQQLQAQLKGGRRS